MNNNFSFSEQKGFTLIEIIIALLVISVALGAIISTTGNSVSHGAYLKEKTITLWVAENHLSEIVITKQWPTTGQHSFEITMAGKTWYLNNKVTQTPNQFIRRLDISVYGDKAKDNSMTSMIAYIHKPQVLISKESTNINDTPEA